MRKITLALVSAALLAGCSESNAINREASTGDGVTLRNLTETDIAVVPHSRDFPLKGQKVATPSDSRSDYYLLRVRTAASGTVISMLREERGQKVAYARTETDCRTGRIHILGVGSTRAEAEVATTGHDTLRSTNGLPLRQELARAICARSGEPLTAA